MSPVQTQLCMFSCGNVFSAYQCADLPVVSGSKCEFQQLKPSPAGACSGRTAISFNESLSFSKVRDEASKWVNEICEHKGGFLLLRIHWCAFETSIQRCLEFAWIFHVKPVIRIFLWFIKFSFYFPPFLLLNKEFPAVCTSIWQIK